MEGKEAFQGHSAQVVEGVMQSGSRGCGPLAGLGPVPMRDVAGASPGGTGWGGAGSSSLQASTGPGEEGWRPGAESLFHRL